MTELWGKVGEREEDKTALGQARMGDGKARGADNARTIEKDIEVEGPWGVAKGSAAAEAALDEEQQAQKAQRRQQSAGFDDAVEKPALGAQADGLRLVERRLAQDAHMRPAEHSHGALDVQGAVADVGAKRKVNGCVRHEVI